MQITSVPLYLQLATQMCAVILQSLFGHSRTLKSALAMCQVGWKEWREVI